MSRKKKPSMLPSLGLCTLLVMVVVGNHIEFTANPDIIKTSINPTLRVRCSLSADPASPSTTSTSTTLGLVGRDLPGTRNDFEEAEYNDDVTRNVILRSSSGQNEAIAHVTSIIISRGSDVIASVTSFTAAHLEHDADKVNGLVDGDVSGTSTNGQLGYLSLQWSSPTTVQTGVYMCTLKGITHTGHTADLTHVLEVKALDVSLGDVLNEVNDLKSRLSDQNATFVKMSTDYQTTIAEQNNTMNSLKSSINTLRATSWALTGSLEAVTSRADTQQKSLEQCQSQLSGLKATTDSHASQISQLQSDVMDALHVEQGTIRCGGDARQHDWDAGRVNLYGDYTFGKSKSVSHTFRKAYTRAPVVFLSVSQVNTHKDMYAMYGIGLKNVSSQGFDLVCGTGYPSFFVAFLQISWISVSV